MPRLDPYNLPSWMSDPNGAPQGTTRTRPEDTLPSQPLSLTLEQAFARSETVVRPETIVTTTLKVLGNGHNVFRTLVRMYRRDKNLIPVEYRASCAQYDPIPIDKVPLAPPIAFPKLSPTTPPV